MALRHWLQLALTGGIGPILTARLIEAAGDAESACTAGEKQLRLVEGIGAAKAAKIAASLREAAGEVDAEIERAASVGAIIISRDDPQYPELLKVIPDPPSVLYVRGNLEPRDLQGIAIVGSRRCSIYGREQADRFGGLLAGAGFTVISGGARGVDSASHRGALAIPNGRTIAVLGCGVDIAYPPENQPLFGQIAQRGAVISEFPMGSPPMRDNFPRRNRIISGMSRGVLVVEADVASGALITARQACDDHGRPVFALPGRVDNPMSAGPHALIRDGATLVTCLDDLLGGLDPLPYAATVPAELPRESDAQPQLPLPALALTDRQSRILQAIESGNDPTHLDRIIESSELPPEIVMQELTMMSLRGAVRRVDGQTFCRRS